jgi:hypothetical protein
VRAGRSDGRLVGMRWKGASDLKVD